MNALIGKPKTTMVITLTPETELTVKGISGRNNLIIRIPEETMAAKIGMNSSDWNQFVMNKKYYNQIHSNGYVEGRLKLCENELVVFEGFSFK
jgi:hypothetical protein